MNTNDVNFEKFKESLTNYYQDNLNPNASIIDLDLELKTFLGSAEYFTKCSNCKEHLEFLIEFYGYIDQNYKPIVTKFVITEPVSCQCKIRPAGTELPIVLDWIIRDGSSLYRKINLKI